jgi:hypothetical protein
MPIIEKTGNETKRPWLDSVWFGLTLGLICPWVVFVGYYIVFHRHITLKEFFNYLKLGDSFISALSVCVFLSNLLVFFIFIWTRKDKSARGVLAATFMYAFFVAIMKAIE